MPEEDWVLPDREFFAAGAVDLAPRLLGCLLERRMPDCTRSGIIVETEAYLETEPSCHAWSGPSPRNRPMFEEGGYAYVYLIYGMHHCFNVSAGMEGSGEAVLIRALQPLRGLAEMEAARGTDDRMNLCSGPGKLCQALGIDRSHNGVDLLSGDLRILRPRFEAELEVSVGPRIGISKAADLPYRFCIRDSAFLSR